MTGYTYIVPNWMFSYMWKEARNSRSIHRRITNDYTEPDRFKFGGIMYIRVSEIYL